MFLSLPSLYSLDIMGLLHFGGRGAVRRCWRAWALSDEGKRKFPKKGRGWFTVDLRPLVLGQWFGWRKMG